MNDRKSYRFLCVGIYRKKNRNVKCFNCYESFSTDLSLLYPNIFRVAQEMILPSFPLQLRVLLTLVVADIEILQMIYILLFVEVLCDCVVSICRAGCILSSLTPAAFIRFKLFVIIDVRKLLCVDNSSNFSERDGRHVYENLDMTLFLL